MSRSKASDKPTFEATEGSLGGGVNGMTGLCYMIDRGSRDLVVVKPGEMHEANLMQDLDDVAEIPDMVYAEPIADEPDEWGRVDDVGLDAGASDKPEKCRLYIRACELGSLEAQNLPDKVASGEISQQAYMAYLFQVISRTNSALEQAHDRGILHLDINPRNIFIAADGQPYLGDFGHGVRCPPDGSVTLEPGRSDNGTAYYATPEYLDRSAGREAYGDTDSHASAATDTWALGCLLGLMLGPAHEVAIMPHERYMKNGADAGALFAMMCVAEEADLGERATQGEAAKATLDELLDGRSEAFTEDELHAALIALSQIMTTPIEQRPDSRMINAYLEQLRPWVPEVSVTTALDMGSQPRIATIETKKPTLAAVAEAGDDDLALETTDPSLLSPASSMDSASPMAGSGGARPAPASPAKAGLFSLRPATPKPAQQSPNIKRRFPSQADDPSTASKP